MLSQPFVCLTPTLKSVVPHTNETLDTNSCVRFGWMAIKPVLPHHKQHGELQIKYTKKSWREFHLRAFQTKSSHFFPSTFWAPSSSLMRVPHRLFRYLVGRSPCFLCFVFFQGPCFFSFLSIYALPRRQLGDSYTSAQIFPLLSSFVYVMLPSPFFPSASSSSSVLHV